MNEQHTADAASEYLVPVFRDERDRRTRAVGFLSETGDGLALTIDDPVTIIAVAHRMVQLADEIAETEKADADRLSAELRALGPNATMGDLIRYRQKLAAADVPALAQERARRGPLHAS